MAKYDNWKCSPYLKWDRRHLEAIKQLVQIGVFSTEERAVAFLRGQNLNPIPILNHYLQNHDCYFLRKILRDEFVIGGSLNG